MRRPSPFGYRWIQRLSQPHGSLLLGSLAWRCLCHRTQGQVAAKSKDLTRVVTKLFGVDAGKRGISLEQFRTLVTRVQDLVRDMQIRARAVGCCDTALMA